MISSLSLANQNLRCAIFYFYLMHIVILLFGFTHITIDIVTSIENGNGESIHIISDIKASLNPYVHMILYLYNKISK